MKSNIEELKKLKGVGDVLAQRLVKAGLNSIEKIADAGEEGLGKIKGVNPRMLDSIIEQAKELSGKTSLSKKQRIKEVKKTAAKLKEQLEGLASDVRKKFGEELVTKTGKKVGKELLKVLGYMEKIEGGLESKVKKTGKSLFKAEKRVMSLGAAGLKEINKGLRKTRKSLKKLLG